MDWWQGFFDDDSLWLFAPVLDPERTEREVAGAVRLLRLRDGERVADLGCGDGRHAVALARRGLRVAGLDWSAPALAAARRRAQRMDAQPRLVRADLRALPLAAGTFDAAVALFSTLGYEDDATTRAMLAQAARVLRPGGRLLVEVTGRDRAVRDFAVRREWYEIEGRCVRVERRIDVAAGEEQALFHYDRGDGPRTRTFRRRLFTPGELGALLREAGFARVDWAGDYDGSPLTLDSPLLLAVARRAPTAGA